MVQNQVSQQQPQQKKSRVWLWVLIGMGAIPGSCIALGVIGAIAGAGKTAGAADTGAQAPAAQAALAAPPAQQERVVTATPVDIDTLLSEYKDNEVRADAQFKGKVIRVTGRVDDVKKDILNKPYVTIGTGAPFEIPQVQCSLRSSEAAKAAQLSKGSTVTVTGKVSGLMMNVQVSDCAIE